MTIGDEYRVTPRVEVPAPAPQLDRGNDVRTTFRPSNRFMREETRTSSEREWMMVQVSVEHHMLTQPLAANPHPDDVEIDVIAGGVLDTGKRRMRVDDYEARMDRFAEEMGKLDVDSRARLLARILEKDEGALSSWLTLDRLSDRVRSGNVSVANNVKIAEGFAYAYNTGLIDTMAAADLTGFYTASAVGAPAFNAENFNRTMAFFGSSDSAEMNAFREKFAGDMLQHCLDPRYPLPETEVALAIHIMSTSPDPDMAARVFAGFNASDRQRILEMLGAIGIGYDRSQGEIPGLTDPMSDLIKSVAQQPNSPPYSDIAVQIVRFAQSSDDQFFYDHDHKPFEFRAEALSVLFLNHADPILKALTERDISKIIGSGNGEASLAGQNAIDLGNLLRITALNPDNAYQANVFARLEAYAGELKALINQDPSTLTVAERERRELAKDSLAMLGAAMVDGLKEGYIDLKNDAAARKQLIGFIADVALAGLPLNKLASDGVKSALNNVFENERVQKALENVAGELVDKSTGALTDETKDAIAGALGEDKAFLETQKQSVNNFISNAVLSGLTLDEADIKDYIQTLEDAIERTRNG
jgi:hypothetical protein